MNCWRKFVLEHLNGNTPYSVEINSETDWVMKYEASESVWLKAISDLEKNQSNLQTALENLNEEQLDELVPGKKFSWYVLVHGLIHHDIYHSAQISLLKK
jgi:hypothetical protein